VQPPGRPRNPAIAEILTFIAQRQSIVRCAFRPTAAPNIDRGMAGAMIDKALEISSPIGLIAAGAASMPFCGRPTPWTARRHQSRAFRAERPPAIPYGWSAFRHHWISIGQLGKATKAVFAPKNCPRSGVHRHPGAAGAVRKFAWIGGTLRVIGRVWAAFPGRETIICCLALARFSKTKAFRMVGIKDVAPGSPDAGRDGLTLKAPDEKCRWPISPGGRDCAARTQPVSTSVQATVVIGTVT